ncbi:DUF924 family protein [Marinobacterium iners]|jgi:uncharacterized protein (DUF924 family)|uniref:DUF924 domain-containing protein n=1 Tax=Marinobacterium iners DSM 11526 TaxID=1122198 RepID=A0A1H4H390_9GAMM|nr:DUF924 family protein [Marinobacterium iners]SEB16216.1 protein of unknown function [Marinobacterium iners DSM 11526]
MFKDVIDFWFNELEPKQWWQKDGDLDSMIQRRFGALHEQARVGELFAWRETTLGSLAEVIKILGRTSTEDEKEFLEQPNSGF